MFAPLIHSLFVALSTHAAGIVLIVLVTWIGLTGPLLGCLAQRFARPALLLAAGATLTLAGLLTNQFGEHPPRAVNLSYVSDCASGHAYWLSTDAKPDPWTQPYLGQHPVKRQLQEVFGENSREYWVASAPDLHILPPSIDMLEEAQQGDIRTLRVHVKPMRQAPQMRVFVENAVVMGASIDGVTVSGEPNDAWVLEYHAFPESGVDIELRVKANAPFRIRAVSRSYGLPAMVQPRGPELIAEANSSGDTVQASCSLELSYAPSRSSRR